MEEGLVSEIERFLAGQAGDVREERLIEDGLLLFLLALRGITPVNTLFELRPSDRDAARLSSYLLSPGLAPGLATAEVDESKPGEPIIRIYPDWERLAYYYGKSLADLDSLLRDRVPLLVQRHRLTLMFLLGD